MALAQSSPLGVGGARFRTGAGAPRLRRHPGLRRLPPGGVRPHRHLRRGAGAEPGRRVQPAPDPGRRPHLAGSLHLHHLLEPGQRPWAPSASTSSTAPYKVRVAQKRRTLPSGRSLVPAAARRRPGRRCPGRASSAGTPASPLGPAAAYAAGTVVAAAVEARRDPGAAVLAPPAFAALHLGYGAGVWWGLWRWRRHFRS